MKDINDILYSEKWELVLDEIKNNRNFIHKLDKVDLATNRYYYQLNENQKGEYGQPLGKLADLKNLIDFCKANGMVGETIPQATAFQQFDQIKHLLLNGHSIDEEDFGETTGLLVAAALNDINLVQFFINNGAFVSYFNQDNYEAIDLTSSTEIFAMLKENGGKTKAEKKQDYDEYCEAREKLNILRDINLSFMKGAEKGDLKQMDEALKNSTMDFMTLNFAYPINGWTALHYAANNNDKKTFDFLISKGIDINKRNIEGLTAKELALKLGHNELV